MRRDRGRGRHADRKISSPTHRSTYGQQQAGEKHTHVDIVRGIGKKHTQRGRHSQGYRTTGTRGLVVTETCNQELPGGADNVRALVHLDGVQGLQRVQHVVWCDGGRGRYLLDRDLAVESDECLDDDLGPVSPITEQAEIGKRLLRGSNLLFDLAQLVRERDEYLPVPHSLELRQPDHVPPVLVLLRHDVEKERIHVVVDGFVVQEQLRQQAEVPAPRPLLSSVDLEKRQVVIPVYLVPRRVEKLALYAVARELLRADKKAEAELADVHRFGVGELPRVRAEVPRLDLVLADLDPVQVLHPRHLADALGHGPGGPQLLDLRLLRKPLGLAELAVVVFRVGGVRVVVHGFAPGRPGEDAGPARDLVLRLLAVLAALGQLALLVEEAAAAARAARLRGGVRRPGRSEKGRGLPWQLLLVTLRGGGPGLARCRGFPFLRLWIFDDLRNVQPSERHPFVQPEFSKGKRRQKRDHKKVRSEPHEAARSAISLMDSTSALLSSVCWPITFWTKSLHPTTMLAAGAAAPAAACSASSHGPPDFAASGEGPAAPAAAAGPGVSLPDDDGADGPGVPSPAAGAAGAGGLELAISGRGALAAFAVTFCGGPWEGGHAGARRGGGGRDETREPREKWGRSGSRLAPPGVRGLGPGECRTAPARGIEMSPRAASESFARTHLQETFPGAWAFARREDPNPVRAQPFSRPRRAPAVSRAAATQARLTPSRAVGWIRGRRLAKLRTTSEAVDGCSPADPKRANPEILYPGNRWARNPRRDDSTYSTLPVFSRTEDRFGLGLGLALALALATNKLSGQASLLWRSHSKDYPPTEGHDRDH
ncbi:MAG: hypothetical protein BJ554DRAFT_8158, partial [Olpidium bornovanus]